jgi:hypothetical protein
MGFMSFGRIGTAPFNFSGSGIDADYLTSFSFCNGSVKENPFSPDRGAAMTILLKGNAPPVMLLLPLGWNFRFRRSISIISAEARPIF